MMSGKPIISSNVNGIPEHVLPEFGALVDPRDEDALSKNIEDFLKGELNFDAKQIRAYALEHFGYQSVGHKFLKVYESIL